MVHLDPQDSSRSRWSCWMCLCVLLRSPGCFCVDKPCIPEPGASILSYKRDAATLRILTAPSATGPVGDRETGFIMFPLIQTGDTPLAAESLSGHSYGRVGGRLPAGAKPRQHLVAAVVTAAWRHESKTPD